MDLLIDLENPRWDLIRDNAFRFVYAAHVLEHVPHRSPHVDGELWMPLINELLRVMQHQAVLEVHVPHWRNPNAMGSMGHCRVVTLQHFLPWMDDKPYSNEVETVARITGHRLRLLQPPSVSRAFKVGPLTDYHVRKYLGLEVGKSSQLNLVLEVVKQ